ncbi:MAG: hypothetical protein OXG13_04810 [Gemmatimonadaceae bacterium]|nr:hypothetical protein [Gemmatimonadaceae bacterium]
MSARRGGRRPRPRPQPLWLSVEVGQFSAQALERARPGLRGSAFVVLRQSRDSHRAAVQAVSARARDLGVEPGTLLFAMRRAHRGRVAVVDRDESAEATAAETVTAVLERWTPSFRVRRGWARLSAILDLGGTPAARAGGWRAAGAELQGQLAGASGLGEIAVGVSTARLVARVLGREALPGGVVLCAPGDEDRVLARTELADLPGLGSVCRERAARYGIHTVGQVLPLDRRALRRRFGRRTGERLYGVVRGLEVEARPGAPGVVEAETVLREDANDDSLLRAAVALTVDRACHELRLRGLAAKALILRIAYTDDRRAQKTTRLPAATDEFPVLCAAAEELFRQIHVRRAAVRTIAAVPSRTSPASGQQDLFDGEAGRRRRCLGAAITDIRSRMGFGAVVGADALEVAASGQDFP